MKRDTTLKNDLIIKTLLGEPTERTPVWMMRQAGRYLPEYIKLREKYSFFERCQKPELACEILYSLLILSALTQQFCFQIFWWCHARWEFTLN